MQDLLQGPVPRPLLEVAVAGLVRRVAIRQIRPLGTGPKNPKGPVQDLAQVLARSPSAILPPPVHRQQRRDELPLGIREIHGVVPSPGGQ